MLSVVKQWGTSFFWIPIHSRHTDSLSPHDSLLQPYKASVTFAEGRKGNKLRVVSRKKKQMTMIRNTGEAEVGDCLVTSHRNNLEEPVRRQISCTTHATGQNQTSVGTYCKAEDIIKRYGFFSWLVFELPGPN